MTPEQLDSLLLDRALGELPSAVVSLLEEHLARDAGAARRATELGATVDLARRAGAAESAGPIRRPLDVARLRQVEAIESATRQRSEFYRLAACLAVGLGAGWLLRPGVSPAPTASLAPAAAYVSVPEEPQPTFWSLTRIAGSRRDARFPAAGTLLQPPAR